MNQLKNAKCRGTLSISFGSYICGVYNGVKLVIGWNCYRTDWFWMLLFIVTENQVFRCSTWISWTEPFEMFLLGARSIFTDFSGLNSPGQDVVLVVTWDCVLKAIGGKQPLCWATRYPIINIYYVRMHLRYCHTHFMRVEAYGDQAFMICRHKLRDN